MQKYRCYYKDDFGYPYDAMCIKEDDGDWCRSEDVDAEIARLAHETAMATIEATNKDRDLLKDTLRWCLAHGARFSQGHMSMDCDVQGDGQIPTEFAAVIAETMTARTPVQQQTCCCPSPFPRRCYEIRHPPPIDDLERVNYFSRLQEDGDECDCSCHEPEYPDDCEGDCDE